MPTFANLSEPTTPILLFKTADRTEKEIYEDIEKAYSDYYAPCDIISPYSRIYSVSYEIPNDSCSLNT